MFTSSTTTPSVDQGESSSLQLIHQLGAEQLIHQVVAQQQQLTHQLIVQHQADKEQQAAEILLLKREVFRLCHNVGKLCSHQDQAAGLQISCKDGAEENNSSLHQHLATG